MNKFSRRILLLAGAWCLCQQLYKISRNLMDNLFDYKSGANGGEDNHLDY